MVENPFIHESISKPQIKKILNLCDWSVPLTNRSDLLITP